ncbi:MAG: DUF2892 domain-containing protein [Gemmatimonadetes bacterium]|nr:DUF2892 domain-containing protein [Gemmatimonadota bacterium]MBL0178532.1 DUF2892 domain-containing protein [Gemmatimonadota bacterium]
MPCNESPLFRGIRVVAGLAMLYLGWTHTVTGTAGTVLQWLGFVPLLTGLTGFCPLYSALGINRCGPKAA